MKAANRDVKQVLYAYVLCAQEIEGKRSMIRKEMEYTKTEQMTLLGMFLMLRSHSSRNYQKGNKKRKSVKEKDEQNLSVDDGSVSSRLICNLSLKTRKKKRTEYLEK